MSSKLNNIARQEGAAIIEGLATMMVLLSVLLLATFIGSAYYNLSVMNTAAQNIALNVETQQDRYCQTGISAQICTSAVDQVKNGMAAKIATEAGNHLVFSTGISLTPTSIQTSAPGRGSSPAPPSLASNSQWPSCAGWGYSDVTLNTNLKLFSNIGNFNGLQLNDGGNTGLAMQAKALSFSFARPSSGSAPGC